MMPESVRLLVRAVFEFEYEANPADYPESSTPEQMAAEDQEFYRDNPSNLLDEGAPEVTVEVVESE